MPDPLSLFVARVRVVEVGREGVEPKRLYNQGNHKNYKPQIPSRRALLSWICSHACPVAIVRLLGAYPYLHFQGYE